MSMRTRRYFLLGIGLLWIVVIVGNLVYEYQKRSPRLDDWIGMGLGILCAWPSLLYLQRHWDPSHAAKREADLTPSMVNRWLWIMIIGGVIANVLLPHILGISLLNILLTGFSIWFLSIWAYACYKLIFDYPITDE